MNNQKCREYLRTTYASDELQHGLLGSFFKKHKYIKREEMPPGSKTRYRYIYDEADQSSTAVPKKTIADAIKGVFRSLSKVGEKVYDTTHKAKLAALQTTEKVHKYIAKLTSPTGKIRYFYDEKVMNRVKKMWEHWKNDTALRLVPRTSAAEEGEPVNEAINAGGVNPGGRKSGKFRDVNCALCSIAFELRNRGYDVTAKDQMSDLSFIGVSKLFGYDDVKVGKRKVVVTASKEWAKKKFRNASQENSVLKRKIVSRDRSAGTVELELTLVSIESSDSGVKTMYPCQVDDQYVFDGYSKASGEKAAKSLLKMIDEYPDGSRGEMAVGWVNGGGHSVAWVKDDNGAIKIIDTQGGYKIWADTSSSTYDISYLVSALNNVTPTYPIATQRLDNKDVTNSDILKYIDY